MNQERLNIFILWHLHQPIYHSAENSKYILPWVRLHGIKAYYDMAQTILPFDNVGLTFNLTPSLISQLQDYTDKKAEDYYLELSYRPAGELEHPEKKTLIEKFFQCNWETMIKPYPRYKELHQLRQSKEFHEFSEQELLDLQTWFNLAWFGFAARQQYPELNELTQKDRNFSKEDKHRVLAIQQNILEEILPLYQKIDQKKQIEISTTPYYHPILPLVYDTNIARRCLMQEPLPENSSYPEDARQHIKKAKTLYQEIFGHEPAGFWPAEGSVSPEIAELFAEEGAQWIATDEEILWHSKANLTRDSLFHPYSMATKNGHLSLYFRDKGLSDAIGFQYAKMDSQAAIQTFLQNIYQIAENHNNEQVAIILDGENPWEYYYDGGEHFLTSLYQELNDNSAIQAYAMRDNPSPNLHRNQLNNLHSGSWINGNYKIWIGDKEENQAWEYIKRTRDRITQIGDDKDKAQKALEYLYVAQGSDWFWWYGDDFQSETKSDFDGLFRSYLIAAWRTLEEEVPAWLNQPILSHKDYPSQKSTEYLKPIIDGYDSHFYEWQGAAVIKAEEEQSAIYNSQKKIKEISYGFNNKDLFLRISSSHLALEATEENHITLLIYPRQNEEDQYKKIDIPLKQGTQTLKEPTSGATIVYALEQTLEVSIPYDSLGFPSDTRGFLFLEWYEKQQLIERIPQNSMIPIEFPHKSFITQNWFI